MSRSHGAAVHNCCMHPNGFTHVSWLSKEWGECGQCWHFVLSLVVYNVDCSMVDCPASQPVDCPPDSQETPTRLTTDGCCTLPIRWVCQRLCSVNGLPFTTIHTRATLQMFLCSVGGGLTFPHLPNLTQILPPACMHGAIYRGQLNHQLASLMGCMRKTEHLEETFTVTETMCKLHTNSIGQDQT